MRVKTTVPGVFLFAVTLGAALLVGACSSPAGSPVEDEPEIPISAPLGPGLYAFTGEVPPREAGENVVKVPTLPFTLANALRVIEAETEELPKDTDPGTLPLPKNYLLVIDRDTLLQTWTMKGNVSLTIRGFETERLIQLYNAGASEELPEYNSESLFAITDHASLILEENITLVGSLANSAFLVSVSQGSFAMHDSTRIQNNGAGGVRVWGDRARFTMHGGEISDCTIIDSGNASPGGAGVQLAFGGTFAMKGGVIRNNRFELTKDSDGRYNRLGGGGGVSRDSSSGPFIMEGGEITGNYSYKNGGGVYGDFTISGGLIRLNSSGDPNPLRRNIQDMPVTEGEDFVIEGWNEPYQLVLTEKGDATDQSVTEVVTGNRLEFSAAVTGLGAPSQKVNWSIPEPHNPYTTLSDGVLVIGAGETAASLTIRAASAVNPTVYDERAVTIRVYDESRLWVKFELRSPDRTTELFSALQDYIRSGELDGGNPRGVRVGDYYDLPRLNIASDGVAPAVSGNNTFMDDGTGIFRVVIVGINSFKGINGNTDSHVVFQFRNAVISRRMNGTAANEGGYAGSEMRAYLGEYVLPGLIAAGIPQTVLWNPVRVIARGGDTVMTDTVADYLWLATALETNAFTLNELLGYSESNAWLVQEGEVRENQALLEYYASAADADSAKSLVNRRDMAGNSGIAFWLASPGQGTSYFAALMKKSNRPNTFYHVFERSLETANYGILPAFCVK